MSSELPDRFFTTESPGKPLADKTALIFISENILTNFRSFLFQKLYMPSRLS